MSFENLLAAAQAEAEELKKSQSDEGADKKIQAAADEGEADPDLENQNGDGDGDDEGEDDGAPITKSFRFTLEDGTEVEAEDGTELVKSLMEQQAGDRAAIEQVMGATLDLVKSMRAAQAKDRELIKSLQSQVASLSTKGAGRKAVLSVNEKTPATMRKSVDDEPQGLSGQEFLAKAIDAQGAGKITGLDVARCESALNHGEPVPADIVANVLAHSK